MRELKTREVLDTIKEAFQWAAFSVLNLGMVLADKIKGKVTSKNAKKVRPFAIAASALALIALVGRIVRRKNRT